MADEENKAQAVRSVPPGGKRGAKRKRSQKSADGGRGARKKSTIINDLLSADLVIADLTEHNPNVLFELGVRMAHEKPVALIKSSGTGRIFDVDNILRVEEYNSNLWSTTVEKDLPVLTGHIRAAWENRESKQTYMGILKSQGSVEAK